MFYCMLYCTERLPPEVTLVRIMGITAFALLIIGTAGLLTTEFSGNWGGQGWEYLVETFAVFNVLGLAALGWARWASRRA